MSETPTVGDRYLRRDDEKYMELNSDESVIVTVTRLWSNENEGALIDYQWPDGEEASSRLSTFRRDYRLYAPAPTNPQPERGQETRARADERRERYAAAIQRRVVPGYTLTSILPEVYEAAEAAMVVADAEQAATVRRALEEAAEAVDVKLTAEPSHNRASAFYEVLLLLRGMFPCTCARCGGLHEKSCLRYVPGHELLSPENALAAYRAAAVATPAREQDERPAPIDPREILGIGADQPERWPHRNDPAREQGKGGDAR